MLRFFYTDEKTDNRFFQWLLGFQPSAGVLLLNNETKKVVVFLDGRYIDTILSTEQQGYNIEKILFDKSIIDLLREYRQDEDIIVIEKDIPYRIVTSLQKSNIGVQWQFDEEDRQKNIRIKKSKEEIACIYKAVELTENIWSRIKKRAFAGDLSGKTELEVRGMIIEKAYSLGLEGEAFDTIVATGEYSAIPHYQTGRNIIGSGPLLVDMGFRWKGWCSDFTRCIWIPSSSIHAHSIFSPLIGRGDKSESDIQGGILKNEFEKILKIVRKAHDVAREMVIPGTAFKDIALTARKVIEDAGYGEYFTHSLGHGVGLDVHEAPTVNIKSEDIIKSGMVFTIEPGIYLPGRFGVRWENIVVVAM